MVKLFAQDLLKLEFHNIHNAMTQNHLALMIRRRYLRLGINTNLARPALSTQLDPAGAREQLKLFFPLINPLSGTEVIKRNLI